MTHCMNHTMSYNNQNQDWSPVIIQGGGSSQQQPVTQRSAGAAALHRAETDEKPRERFLTTESIVSIQGYRRTNSKTQREIDQMCSFPAGTIGSLEGRRTAPSSRQLSELSRTLKLTLTLDK
jgi:hypothetical protein